jgi:hypothetical protein
LPQSKLKQLKSEKEEWLETHPKPWTPDQIFEYRELFPSRIEKWLDAGYGHCHLKEPDVQTIVCHSLMRFNEVRLTIHASVIMPNHVHALIEPTLRSKPLQATPRHQRSQRPSNKQLPKAQRNLLDGRIL